MKLRTLRRLSQTAPRHVRRRRALDKPDPTAAEAAPTPEAVFDRMTGPYGGRYSSFDEET